MANPTPTTLMPVYGDLKAGECFRILGMANTYAIYKALKDFNFFKLADTHDIHEREHVFVDEALREGYIEEPSIDELLSIDDHPIFSLGEHFITYLDAHYYTTLLGTFFERIPQHQHMRLSAGMTETIRISFEVDTKEGEPNEMQIDDALAGIVRSWTAIVGIGEDRPYLDAIKGIHDYLRDKELKELAQSNIATHGFHVSAVLNKGDEFPNYLFTTGMVNKFDGELFTVQGNLSLNETGVIFGHLCSDIQKEEIALEASQGEICDEDGIEVLYRYRIKPVEREIVQAAIRLPLTKKEDGSYPDLYQVFIANPGESLPGDKDYRGKELVF